MIDNELRRLRAQERAYDPLTTSLLQGLALPPGASCLEIAAGAGSIARWMRGHTTGPVVALDTDVAHLASIPGLEVTQADVRTWQPAREFDLVHCRLLLDLLPRPAAAVLAMARATATGGYLVLEEFDDLTAPLSFGLDEQVTRHARVLAAKQAAFGAAGHQNHLGRHLPAMINDVGAFRIHAAGHVDVRQGGSPDTEPWRRYLRNQTKSLLESGHVDRSCLEAYGDQLCDPSFLYFAPMLVSVVAEKL